MEWNASLPVEVSPDSWPTGSRRRNPNPRSPAWPPQALLYDPLEMKVTRFDYSPSTAQEPSTNAPSLVDRELGMDCFRCAIVERVDVKEFWQNYRIMDAPHATSISPYNIKRVGSSIYSMWYMDHRPGEGMTRLQPGFSLPNGDHFFGKCVLVRYRSSAGEFQPMKVLQMPPGTQLPWAEPTFGSFIPAEVKRVTFSIQSDVGNWDMTNLDALKAMGLRTVAVPSQPPGDVGTRTHRISTTFSGGSLMSQTVSMEGKVIVDEKVCTVCMRFAKHHCGKCGKAAYCSKECQVSAWPSHKKVCKS